jgi:RNA polymerase sigma-70 factor (ECF subfamily)
MKPVPMEHSRVAVCDAAGGSANGDALDERDWRDCRQCLEGSEAACTGLFKRHEPRIAKQMWRFTRDRTMQAELVQEVFVQAYLSLHRYRPKKVPFEHWLVRIATRVGYQFWKRQARGRRMQSLEGLDFAAPPATREVEAEAAAAAEMLHKLLACLPAKDRLVLTLMYFDECGIKEIAEQTGWNSAMVKMRAYRARGRLKQIIEERNLTETLLGFGHGPA